VYKVLVGVGDKIKENQTLIMLEAMKMETPVASPCDGEVVSIEVEQGQVVETGQLILTILPS
jgi:biotin carboxyl carrier protein